MHRVFKSSVKYLQPLEKRKRIMETNFTEVADGLGSSSNKDREEKTLCDNCTQATYGSTTGAERFCIKCEEKLCLSCSQEHEKKEEHLVVALNDEKEIQYSKEADFCADHNELLELYCACCRKVICSGCQKKSHGSHSCLRVEDAADLVAKQVESEYESLSDMQSHFEKEREKLVGERMKVTKTVKEMEDEVRKRCDEITEFVHNETKTLLRELDVFKKERLDEIELEIRKLEEHAFTFRKFKQYCDKIRRNAVPRNTCEAEGVLRNISDDLHTRLGSRWKSALFSVEFSIHKTDMEEVLTSVGKLIIKCPFKLNKSATFELNEKKVYGMARLQDRLYVLSKSLKVHRLQHPFVVIGELEAPDFKSPRRIVSCAKTSRLYIYDKGDDCIWKVAVPTHEVSLYLHKVKQPTSFSVTSNAELLILRNNKPVCLEVYENAILVRRLKLPATISSLQYVCEAPCGIYFGRGEQTVFKFRRNGSISDQMSPYKDISKCFELSPYHIFLHSGPRSTNNLNAPSVCEWGAIQYLSKISLPSDKPGDRPNSLQIYDDLRIPGNTCYFRETKQLVILEELGSGEDRACYISVYEALPG